MGQINSLPLPFKTFNTLNLVELSEFDKMLNEEINTFNEDGVSFICDEEYGIVYNIGNIIVTMTYPEFEKEIKSRSKSNFVLSKIVLDKKIFIIYNPVSNIKNVNNITSINLLSRNEPHCC